MSTRARQERRHAAGEPGGPSDRRTAPGKTPRTNALSRSHAIQRRPAVKSSQGSAGTRRTLAAWTQDQDMLAAHGFTPGASSTGVHMEDGPAPDAIVIVVARKAGAEVARWTGPMDWYWELPMRFTGTRGRHGWQWSDAQAATFSLQSASRHEGGVPITTWAREHRATDVEIVLVPHPGRAQVDAGSNGFGTHGQGRGGEPTSHAGGEQASSSSHASETRDGKDRGGENGDGLGAQGLGRGAGRDGDEVTQGAGEPDGRDSGDEQGSDNPSWIADTGAEIDADGGRTPTDHGQRGGSAGGSQGGSGHVHGSGWLDVIDAPAALAPVINAALLVTEADVAGATERLFQQAVKRIARKALDKAIEREVKGIVRRALKQEERRLRAMRGLSKTERARILAQAHDALERELRERLQAQAVTRATDSEALVAQLAGRTDEVSAHARELAGENAAAYRHIAESAEVAEPVAAPGPTRSADATGQASNTGHAGQGTAAHGLPGETIAVERVKLAGSEHAVRLQRSGDDVEIWLCSDCGRMAHKIEAILAQVADNGPTRSLHRRLARLRDKVRDAESRLRTGALPREHLHRELNQIGAHLRDLSEKHPGFDELCFFENFKATKLAPEEVFDVASFEKRLVRLGPGERVALVRETAATLAKRYGWSAEPRLRKLNERDVYYDPSSKISMPSILSMAASRSSIPGPESTRERLIST